MKRALLQPALVALLVAAAPATAMPLCSGPVRITCVVDGDTVWIKGEKIRLENIDTPEVDAPCGRARILAAQAAERLRQLLDGAEPVIARNGLDRYGRTLARLSVAGRDLGDQLVAEGLAKPWTGCRAQFCERPLG